LVRLVGASVAWRSCCEGRIFDALGGKEKGLVTRVVADAEVAAEARATAQRIAEGAPLVARWHKQFARRLARCASAHRGEYDECFACFDSEDFRHRLRGIPGQTKTRIRRTMSGNSPAGCVNRARCALPRLQIMNGPPTTPVNGGSRYARRDRRGAAAFST